MRGSGYATAGCTQLNYTVDLLGDHTIAIAVSIKSIATDLCLTMSGRVGATINVSVRVRVKGEGQESL